MPAPWSFRTPSSRRRSATSPTGSDDHARRKNQVPSSLSYFGVALIAVWLLQVMVAPFLPHALETIDAEVRRIVGEQFQRATALLTAHRGALERLSGDLLEAESLDGKAVLDALANSEHAVAS